MSGPRCPVGWSRRRANCRSRQPVDWWTAGGHRTGRLLTARRPQLHALSNNNKPAYQ
jgi:hypothetical protein